MSPNDRRRPARGGRGATREPGPDDASEGEPTRGETRACVTNADYRLESDAQCALSAGGFGARVNPDRQTVSLPPAVYHAATARYAYTASALIAYARCHPDDLAGKLGSSEDAISGHLKELLSRLEKHLPEKLLDPPRPLDVSYIELPKPDAER